MLGQLVAFTTTHSFAVQFRNGERMEKRKGYSISLSEFVGNGKSLIILMKDIILKKLPLGV